EGDARMEALGQTVREIEERVGLLAGRPPAGPMPSAPMPSAPMPSAPDARFAGLDRELHDIRLRLDALRAAPRPLGLSAEAADRDARDATERRLRAAIAEIAARQEAIDRAGAVPAMPPPPPAETVPAVTGQELKD